MTRILLVEDDAKICNMIENYFYKKSDTFTIINAENGALGIEKAYTENPDLILLDVMLPEADGFEVCREIRRYNDVPIIFISARTSQDDMLTAYMLGCDDYIVKPFSLPLLYEKVRAMIKRSKGLVKADILSASEIALNPNTKIVISSNKEVELKAKEFGILMLLLENKNSVVSRETILDKIWGYDSLADNRVIDSHIKNLRKKLGENGKKIRTLRKLGYKIEE